MAGYRAQLSCKDIQNKTTTIAPMTYRTYANEAFEFITFNPYKSDQLIEYISYTSDRGYMYFEDYMYADIETETYYSGGMLLIGEASHRHKHRDICMVSREHRHYSIDTIKIYGY